MLDNHKFDRTALQSEVEAFDELLRSRAPLAEKADILPFFRQNRHLAAYMGWANNNIAVPDRLGVERPPLGFQCDVAVGHSGTNQFVLVELENAVENSIFELGPRHRAYPYWASRFEKGYSQLVDWAWRIGLEGQSVSLENIFGTTAPRIHYLLVIGRDHWLNKTANARLEWRRVHNGIQMGSATIWTYDFFLGFVQERLAMAQT